MRTIFIPIVLVGTLAACSSGSATMGLATPPSPLPASSTPTAPQHLYTAFTQSSLPTLAIAEYALPLSSASVPVAVLPSDGKRAAFAVDAARGTIAIAVADSSGESIQFFEPPLSANARAIAQIASGPASIPPVTALPVLGMAFDPAGDLWVATTNDLREFIPPFLSYSVAAVVIPNGAATPALANFTAQRPTFDQTGTLYVNDSTGATSTSGIFTIPPPYTVPPKRTIVPTTLGPLAFDSAGNAIASFSYPALPTPGPVGTPLPQSGMGVYALPISTGSRPSLVFSTPMMPPPNGQRDDATSDGASLYIANHNDGSVFLYQLPIAATDQPVARVSCPIASGACSGTILSMQLQLAP